VKFGHVAFEICEQTDRHTDTLITILYTPTHGKVMIDFACALGVIYLGGLAWV